MFSKRLSPIKIWKDVKDRRERRKSEVLQQGYDRDDLESKIGRHVEETTAKGRSQWEAMYSSNTDPRLRHTDSGLGSSIPGQCESRDGAADTDGQEVIGLPLGGEQSGPDRYASATIRNAPCDGYGHDNNARKINDMTLNSWPVQSVDDIDLQHQERRLAPQISFRSLRPRTKRPKPIIPMPSSTSIDYFQDHTVRNEEELQSEDYDCSVSPVVDEFCDSDRQSLLDMNMSPFASRTDLLGGEVMEERQENTTEEPLNHIDAPLYSDDDDRSGSELEVAEDDPERLEPFFKHFAAPNDIAGQRSSGCLKDVQNPSDPTHPVLEHVSLARGELQPPEEVSLALLKLADQDSSQDHLSFSLSDATRSYWTNEWAKHLEHADKPDSEGDTLERPGSPGVHVEIILPDHPLPDTVGLAKKQVSFSEDHGRNNPCWDDFDGNHTTPDTAEPDGQTTTVDPLHTQTIQSRSTSFNKHHIKPKKQRNFSLPTLNTTLMGQRQSILAVRHQPSPFSNITDVVASPSSEHADKVPLSSPCKTSKAEIDPDDMVLAERRAILLGRRDSAQHSPTSSMQRLTTSPMRPISSRRPPSTSGPQHCRASHHQKRKASTSGSQDGRSQHLSNPALRQSQFSTAGRSKPANPSVEISARQTHLLQNWRQSLATTKPPETIQEDRRAVMLQEKRVEREKREWRVVAQAHHQAAMAGQWDVVPEHMEDLHRRQIRQMQREAYKNAGF